MLWKLLSAGASGLLSLTLLGMIPASSQEPDEPPPPKKKELFGKRKGEPGKKGEFAKKKGEEGPERDLNRAYNLLRRLRAEGQAAGRSDVADPRVDRSRRRVLPRWAEGPARRESPARSRIRRDRTRPGPGDRPRPQRGAVRPAR